MREHYSVSDNINDTVAVIDDDTKHFIKCFVGEHYNVKINTTYTQSKTFNEIK